MASTLLIHRNHSFSLPRAVPGAQKRGGSYREFLKRAPSFFLFGVTVVFLVLYLLLTNSVVAYVYMVSEQEETLSMLQEENRLLDIEFARVNSYSHLLKRSEELNMVDVGEVVRLTIFGGEFARAETP